MTDAVTAPAKIACFLMCSPALRSVSWCAFTLLISSYLGASPCSTKMDHMSLYGPYSLKDVACGCVQDIFSFATSYHTNIFCMPSLALSTSYTV